MWCSGLSSWYFDKPRLKLVHRKRGVGEGGLAEYERGGPGRKLRELGARGRKLEMNKHTIRLYLVCTSITPM